MLKKPEPNIDANGTILFKLPQAKVPHDIGTARDINTVKELCRQVELFVQLERQESLLNSNLDLVKLASQTKQLWLESDLARIKAEALTAIVNPDTRGDILKKRAKKSMHDGRDLLAVAQQHREEFNKFLAERRQAMRSEVQQLFESGPAVASRLGDNISQYSKKLIQVFEQNGQAQLVRMGIVSNIIEEPEIKGFYTTSAQLVPPRDPSCLVLSPDRLSFEFPVPIPTSFINAWMPVYSTVRFSTPLDVASWLALADELLTQTKEGIEQQLKRSSKAKQTASYTLTLAKLLDVVHPSHRLLSSVMTYPAAAAQIVKSRLVQLGYSLENSIVFALDSKASDSDQEPSCGANMVDSIADFDARTTLAVLQLIQKRIIREHRFVFEFTVSNRTCWRVGFVLYSHAFPSSEGFEKRAFPGKDKYSFGYGHDGQVYYNGLEATHTKDMVNATRLTMGDKTYAVLVDSYEGSVRVLAKHDDLKPEQVLPAFGKDATCWTEDVRREQREYIINQAVSPVLALLGSQDTVDFGERPNMSVNFTGPFRCTGIEAQPLNSVYNKATRLWDTASFLRLADPSASLPINGSSAISAGASSAVALSTNEQPLKSFSCFPPAFHKKSTAAIKIQRAFRRWRGRRTRWKLLQDRERAAMVIQRAARALLQKLVKRKKRAVISIQRAWRRRVYIWVCLAKLVYQQPIPELHRAATIIQRAWRNWSKFRNSPLSRLYNRRFEELVDAANKIKKWWKQASVNRVLLYEQIRKRKAALAIQRLWRGYHLRNKLAPETHKLMAVVGSNLLRHVDGVHRVKAAYVIQAAVRLWLLKRLRQQKRIVSNNAATRLQALWRGVWVRLHCHLHLTYGRMTYLLAVRKNLKEAHYILKAYKPTGLVCPKD